MTEETVVGDRRRMRDGSCIEREQSGEFVGYQHHGNSGHGHRGRDKVRR